MYSQKEIQFLCKKYGIIPQRERGQNFLIDRSVLKNIIQVANLNENVHVLEVGAGFGQLTLALLETGAQIWAIESDARLIRALKKLQQQFPVDSSGGHTKLSIIHQDIRKLNIPELISVKNVFGTVRRQVFRSVRSGPLGRVLHASERLATSSSCFSPKSKSGEYFHYKVVSNLPYNITSWFLRMILEQEQKPISMTLLLQKDVAERIVAKPGDMSLLALAVQYYSEPQIIQTVPRTKFWPQPEVDSAVIHFDHIHEPNFAYKKQLFRLARIAFSGKRKQLQNSLGAGLYQERDVIIKLLQAAQIEPTQRPQELALQQWKNLAQQASLLKLF